MAKAKKKTRRRIILVSLLVLILAGVTAVVLWRRRELPITVQTEPVTRRSMTELVAANGRIQPVIQVVINPEISGEIIALPVKEGQGVKPGDLLVKIKPDNYVANTNLMHAAMQGSLASQELARANQEKAAWEFQRVEKMYQEKLISEFEFQASKTTLEVARAQHESSAQQVKQARANLARAMEDLSKTTIVSPINGTVTKLKSQVGERVVGSAMMAGTEIMTLANLDDMEARVDIGEIDVVLIKVGQKARLEVDAFRDRKFNGTVTEIANSSKTGLMSGGGSSQEATKFEVKIRISEKEPFRPGMSVTAEVETRYRTNILAVPIQSVTTRLPKSPGETNKLAKANATAGTNSATGTNAPAGTNVVVQTNTTAGPETTAAGTNTAGTTTNAPGKTTGKKPGETPKPIQVVFLVENERAKMVPVKTGISDDAYMEITEGLQEGQPVVSGGYKAINRDLQEGKKIKIGVVAPETEKK